MKAAVLAQINRIDLVEMEVPVPKRGEVRARLRKVGICGSDVHFFQGHRSFEPGLIMGHEAVGEVDFLGEEASGLSVGDRVVIEPNIPCGQCKFCRDGRGNICVNKQVVGLNRPGCFAEYVVLPARHCWKLPDAISDQDAVTIEPMAVAIHALNVSQARPGDGIAVVGLGAIGMLMTHLALALGYHVVVTEINSKKKQLAQDMGALATDLSNIPADQHTDTLNRLWHEHQVVVVFECSGSSRAASLVADAAPQGSEIVLVGLSGDPATFQPLKIARQGISILPSIVYDHPTDFARTIQLIKAGIIHPGFIISRYLPFSSIREGFERASQGEEIKVVVDIDKSE